MKVKGHLKDLLAFSSLPSNRKKRIAESPATPSGPDPMNRLARRLHPGTQHLVIGSIIEETKTVKTLRLIPDPQNGTGELAYFRAGQYLSLSVEVDGVAITRPYSISSAPFESLGKDGFYEITIKHKENGFLTPYIHDHWQPGTQVLSSDPCGFFYHEALRDKKKITGIAGGSGITPFHSMAREIVHGSLEARILIIYGSTGEDTILFSKEFQELEEKAPDKIKVVHVLSCEEVPIKGCEQGFITADIIRKYADINNSSFFICGPREMYDFMDKELSTFNLPPKRLRREVYGEATGITGYRTFPREAMNKTFQIQVSIGNTTTKVPANAGETILVSLERANLKPPSRCRSGECGFCRTRLVSGEVFVAPKGDGRRAADKKFGYIHACASYPVTDIEIIVV
ncbi:MAG: 2Fe-2S iron-sulfur cluster binding domain-containing protein [Spirochaetales bacterium]|nr:2Fe-2S iron-sulfur cluster binding domain-containing protein [Spirochaetales bacterium]